MSNQTRKPNKATPRKTGFYNSHMEAEQRMVVINTIQLPKGHTKIVFAERNFIYPRNQLETITRRCPNPAHAVVEKGLTPYSGEMVEYTNEKGQKKRKKKRIIPRMQTRKTRENKS